MKTLYSDETYMLAPKIRYALSILFVVIAVLVFASYQTNFTASWFNKPDKVTTIIVMLLCLVFAVIPLFLKVKLAIDAVQIEIHCVKTIVIKKKSIESVTIREISPIKDYGGYGYRIRKGERALITDSSNRGVYITVKDGPNLFISSTEPERLLRAIKGN